MDTTGQHDGTRIARNPPFFGVCKHLKVSEQTWHRWRNQYGGMKAEDTKRLKELEKQDARLKELVAEQALDIDMLKKLSRGNF